MLGACGRESGDFVGDVLSRHGGIALIADQQVIRPSPDREELAGRGMVGREVHRDLLVNVGDLLAGRIRRRTAAR